MQSNKAMLTGKELGAAIESARLKKGVSKVTLARAMDVKPPSVQDWINHGRVAKSRLNALFQYFSDVVGPEHWGVREEWGFGVPARAVDGMVTIPQFDLKAAAGPGRYLETQLRVGAVQVCQDIVSRILRNSGVALTSLALVTVAGDSMEPTINDGDIVVIDRSVQSIERDGVYLFTFGDETFIKRIQRMPKALSINSDNGLYKCWEISPEEATGLHVHGRVIWAWLGKQI
ncbi:S24 family peptidase [Thiomonas arsenitoxydans]|jgi:hypothetical protein|uniref:S24 family peptidase n=1 Tax=Thiomonas arsenitoxydans (strain DSM 22701 / CIP 110005 / 3As) TaxID=426114 RepID=UPI001AC14199|nr:S24 family peptidase [Thiomonas arsenitoxydans]MBN8777503.1 S24 family peptidase [Thiomonas arsenitoxydans]